LAAVASLAAAAALRERRRAALLAERLAARERETHLLSESPDPETILRRAFEAASERLEISRFDLYTIDDVGRVEDAWTLSGGPPRGPRGAGGAGGAPPPPPRLGQPRAGPARRRAAGQGPQGDRDRPLLRAARTARGRPGDETAAAAALFRRPPRRAPRPGEP